MMVPPVPAFTVPAAFTAAPTFHVQICFEEGDMAPAPELPRRHYA